MTVQTPYPVVTHAYWQRASDTFTAVYARCIWAWASSKGTICGYMLLYMTAYPISGCNPHEVTICELLNRSPLPYQATFKSGCCRETGQGCELAGGLGLKIALHQSGFSALLCVERFSHFHPKQWNKKLSQPFHLEIPRPPKQILKRKCRFWPMHSPVISTD